VATSTSGRLRSVALRSERREEARHAVASAVRVLCWRVQVGSAVTGEMSERSVNERQGEA
jgi:hypothetical protein